VKSCFTLGAIAVAFLGMGYVNHAAAQEKPVQTSPLRVGGKLPHPVLNIAHRGASALAPENTLESFGLAIELGCHMFELDVHLTKDGEMVVLHDDDLMRCSNVKAKFPDRKSYFVSDFTAKEIRGLDAGSWFVEELAKPKDKRQGPLRHLTDAEENVSISKDRRALYASGKVYHPTMREALKLAKAKSVYVNIELKTMPRQYAGLTAKVVKLVEVMRMERAVIVSSFDHDALVEVRKLSKAIATAALVSDRLHQPGKYIREFLDADAYHPGCYADYDVFGLNSVNGALTLESVKSARAAGLAVNVWTENDPANMKRLIQSGATGIITDFPHRLREVLAGRD